MIRSRTKKNEDKVDWLFRYRELSAKAEVYCDQAHVWEERALSSKPLTGMPRGGASLTTEDMYIRHIEFVEDAAKYAEEARKAMREIEDAIDTVHDPEQRTMLRYRYIEGFQWMTIAERMHVSIRQIFEWHGRALEEIEIPQLTAVKNVL